MYKSSLPSAKAVVGFNDLLHVSASTASTTGLGIDAVTRKRFASTTHLRKWLRINETGKLNYITVGLNSKLCIDHCCFSLLFGAGRVALPGQRRTDLPYTVWKA